MLRWRRAPSGDGCSAGAAFSSSGSRSGVSAMSQKPRQNAFRSVNLFAERRFYFRIERQVDVDARAEADEAEALAACQRGAGLDIAKDAPRDEAGDLHAGHVAPVGRAQPQSVALVLEGRPVQGGVEEAARKVPAFLHH